jgi:imidazolonepropionase-like amidohydrolase
LIVKAITGSKLIDGTGADQKDDITILIEKNKIIKIGKDITIPNNAEIIEAAGNTVLPGLIDSHLHICINGDPDIFSMAKVPMGLLMLYGYRNSILNLRAGFTTIRDMGAPYNYGIALREAIKQGVVRGPRLLSPGKVISMTGGHADFYLQGGVTFNKMSRVADGLSDCRKAAREMFRDGADFLKICSSGGVMSPADPVDTPQFSIGELKAMVYEAECHGKIVASHAHGATGIKNAVIAGVRTIEHGSLMDEEAVELMADKGCFHIPTIVAGWNIVERGEKAGIPRYAVKKAEEIISEVKKSTLLSRNGGVKVAMGTDAGTPFNRHGENAQELIHLVKTGFTPMEAIQSATKTGSECLGMNEKIGTIEMGKLADIIMVKGDPLREIKILSDPENILMVMKDGIIEVDRRNEQR